MFGVKWEEILAKDSEKEEHEGLGVIQLEIENNAWKVQGLNMPGFKF